MDKNEIYLTDTIELAAATGQARAVIHEDFTEVQGVNDRWELTCARQTLQQRILMDHAKQGVDFIQPSAVTVGVDVLIGTDVTIGPSVVLEGNTEIGNGATIGPFCHLIDAKIGEGVVVNSHSVCEAATVESGSVVGPFARLRPGSRVCTGARVGNFVEMKKSTLGPGAKAKVKEPKAEAIEAEAPDTVRFTRAIKDAVSS